MSTPVVPFSVSSAPVMSLAMSFTVMVSFPVSVVVAVGLRVRREPSCQQLLHRLVRIP